MVIPFQLEDFFINTTFCLLLLFYGLGIITEIIIRIRRMLYFSMKRKHLCAGCFIALHLVTLIILSGCNGSSGSGSNSNDTPAVRRVPATLFGANMAWERLGDNTVDNGELIRDRSFRSAGVSGKMQVWHEILNGGTITWNSADAGDTAPAGGKYYTGSVQFSRSGLGYTGIWQMLIEGVQSGVSYTVKFSSYGVGGSSPLGVFLYDGSFAILDSDLTEVTTKNGWHHHSLTFTPGVTASTAILGIYLSDTGTVKIDEVRLSRTGVDPAVKSSVKTRLGNLGVKSLRWPGGTLVDWFIWRDSVGDNISRGEIRAYDRYETPALGLHEFLDLCEELSIVPMIQVNVLDTSSNAADLVEYILGSESTTQGAIRKLNGRTAPWNVTYFEIGNEPSLEYTGAGLVENTGTTYALLAKNIIAAMRSRAGALGKNIQVGGVVEPAFQLSDWLAGNPNTTVQMIANWNNQVLGSGGIGDVDFLDGHFYAYRSYHADEWDRFRYAIAGGKVLERTLTEKIKPLSGKPIWLTEYHILSEISNVVQQDYLMDFQSGLVVADILMSMIGQDVSGAHIWNLAQGWFGLMRDPLNWYYRPTGHVFKLFSAMAEEEIIGVTVDSPSEWILGAGAGNIPTGLTYNIISAVATKNSATGKPRIIVINRSYDIDRTVTLHIDGFAAGNATISYYQNSDLSAKNEINPTNVTVTTGTVALSNPPVISIPRHSLIRIDMQ